MCKLVEYSLLYGSKIMWGLDCDIKALRIELFKIRYYMDVLKEQQNSHKCEVQVPIELIEKINSYVSKLKRNSVLKCKCK